MIETYGLTEGKPTPSIADVDTALDANTSIIMDVIQALVNGVSMYLRDNADKIDTVVKRLVNSVNGHLRKNTGILKPIGNALVDHVDGALSQNEAIIQTAASNPAVANYLRSVPATAGYQINTPVAPPAAIGVETTYQLYVNCTIGKVVAVPTAEVQGRGGAFVPPDGWKAAGEIRTDPKSALEYLQTYGAALITKNCP